MGKKDQKPIVLLIDELDMLLTRNQSVTYLRLYNINLFILEQFTVFLPKYINLFCGFIMLQVLYNILDWPTRPNSKLIVIGKCSLFTSFILSELPK